MTAAGSKAGGAPRLRRPDTRRWACLKCGCTEARACEDGCWWAAFKICSNCCTPEELQASVDDRTGFAHLLPRQPEGTKTVDQLAAELKVNVNSLRVRLWENGPPETSKYLDGRVWRHVWDAAAVSTIKAMLDRWPIQAGRGHRPGKGKKKV